MRSQLKHISLAGMLFLSAILMQGCSILAWVGILCADVVRCSDVEFESFEHAWVAPPEARQQIPLKRIAVAPFVGDLRMADWGAIVLGQMTRNTTDQDDIALAPQVSRDIQVDTVLFGRVVSKPPQKAFWGSKERYPKRVYLHLVSAEGTLLWKADLPFAVVKGTKDIDEEIVKRVLLTHVRTHGAVNK